MDRNFETQTRYNRLVSISASQRSMLSSTFARTNDLKEAVNTERLNIRMTRQIRKRLSEDAALLEENHKELVSLVDELGTSRTAKGIRTIYFEPPHSLRDQQAEYIRRLKSILALTPAELTATMQLWVPVDAVTSEHGILALGLKASADEIQRALFTHMKQLRLVHSALTALIITVLLLDAFLIFRPLVQRLRKTFEHVMQTQGQLDFMAYHDPETRLFNRRGLCRDVDSQSHRDEPLVLLSLQIENTARIREKLGPDSDEELMDRFAKRLIPIMPADSALARTGDDEFTLALREERYSEHGRAGSIVSTARLPMHVRDIPIQPKVSAGVAHRPADSDAVDDLISKARIARRSSDASTRDISVYSTEIAKKVADEESFADEIRLGLDVDGQLVPYYQFKFDAQDGRIRGMEALARWIHPDRGLISPAEFIPVAEKTGLIAPLTWHLMDQISRDYRAWKQAGLRTGSVAINVSEAVLLHEDLLWHLQKMIDTMNETVPPIEIEVTENIAVSDNLQKTQTILSRIRSLGIAVALDDFGTGYASLTHLLNLEIDVVKIDRSFVNGMLDSAPKYSVVVSIIAMGETMKKTIVAEGVETAEEASALRSIGCDIFQGFYFARPEPADKIFENAKVVKSTANFKVA